MVIERNWLRHVMQSRRGMTAPWSDLVSSRTGASSAHPIVSECTKPFRVYAEWPRTTFNLAYEITHNRCRILFEIGLNHNIDQY